LDEVVKEIHKNFFPPLFFNMCYESRFFIIKDKALKIVINREMEI